MRPVLFFVALTLIALPACGEDGVRRGGADLEVTLTTDPDPVRVGQTRVSVVVSDPAWSPVNGAAVGITTRAPGATVPTDPYTAQGVGAGRYDVTIDFPLSGEWLVTARVEVSGGSWIEVERHLEVVDPGAPD